MKYFIYIIITNIAGCNATTLLPQTQKFINKILGFTCQRIDTKKGCEIQFRNPFSISNH